MSETVEAIADVAVNLGLAEEDLRLLGVDERRHVLERLELNFVGEQGRTSWWEAFQHPFESREFRDGRAFERLDRIAPSCEQATWFVVEADSAPNFAVFATTVLTARRVIAECGFFEYYVVAQDLSWLVCENHHGILFALGAARSRLAALAD